MDAVFAALVSAPLPADVNGRLPFLLADFLGCVQAGGRPSWTSFTEDGVAGTVALLALTASAGDRDDIDWRSLHDPGSVVWPVVVVLAAAKDMPGELVAQAARRGYLTAVTVADRLDPTHRVAWHPTATAGALARRPARSSSVATPPSRSAPWLWLPRPRVGWPARLANVAARRASTGPPPPARPSPERPRSTRRSADPAAWGRRWLVRP